MHAVEPMGRFTFGINDNEVCVEICESDALWLVALLSKIHGFVKAELIDELWTSRAAELTNMSLLPLLLSE